MKSMPCAFPMSIIWGLLILLLWNPSSLPGQKPNPRPNILFCIADDWSYGHASAYGSAWVQTPGFDRVAREGLLFERAYTPNAKCAPSRAIILTGRHSWQLQEAANHWCHFPPQFKTWAETLADHGYAVGTTGKGWGPGFAVDEQGRKRQMTGQPFNQRKAPPPARAMGNLDYAGNFADFLESAPSNQPWSFWYGAYEPHRGYEFRAGVTKGRKKLDDIERVPGYWPDTETVRHDMLDYALEVEHFDAHLVRMLNLLEKRGMLDNTLVIVTSDHGMPFPRVKGQAYEASNHIPLAIRWPRGIAKNGRTIADYVSFVDLAPTILEIAGIPWAASGMATTVGRSLTDIFQSDRSGWVNPERDHVLLGKERHDIGRPNDWGYPIRGILKDNLLYLHNYEPDRWPGGNPETGYLNCDGSPTKTVILQERRSEGRSRTWDLCFGKRPEEELYAVDDDPDCLRNLADSLDYASRKAALREQMEQELRQQSDPRMAGQGHVFDEYPYAGQAHQSFYERFRKGEDLKAGWVNESDFEPEPLSR